MNNTPEALPMPPSLPQTVMTSPAVHPAEIAAEKDNFQTPEVAPVPVEQTTPEVAPVPVEQTTSEVAPVPNEQTTPEVAPVPVEQTTSEVAPVSVEQTTPEVAPVPDEQTTHKVAPVNDMSTFVHEVSNNIDVFMKTNNDKLVTMNNVVEQLSHLGLSDNSAIDSLNNQRIKYMEVLDKIRTSFEEINSITNFIL